MEGTQNSIESAFSAPRSAYFAAAIRTNFYILEIYGTQ
jgi:hypothetical protein